MHVSPPIRALLADPAGLEAQQGRHSASLLGWRDGPGKPLLDAFAAFAGGASLASQPALAGLFSGAQEPRRAVTRLVGALLPVLRDAPFGQVPLRHSITRSATTLLVDRRQDASLTLVAVDGAALAQQPPAATAVFSPAEEWDVVVAGTGQGRLIERRGAPGHGIHPLALEPGLALGRDAEREALLLDRADGPLLLLRLQRRRPGPAPVREVDLASGEQVYQAAASARESRHEIAVSLLGRMGRADAAPVLAQIALDPACGDMLRWQAMRECLGLDTLGGFRALAAIACRPGDTLAAMAGALRARLIEQHPVLAGIEPCPA